MEARHAGELIARSGLKPDVMYTLMLRRLIKTGQAILEEVNRMWLPHVKTWRLNERHYGLFQGRHKNEVFEEYGQQKYQYYRRDFRAVPPPLDPALDPSLDERYADIPANELPTGESLELAMKRLIPFIETEIVAHQLVERNKTVLIVTHGSIVRSLIKHFANVSDADISRINAPTGVPLVFDLNDNGTQATSYYYLDEDLAKRGIAKVAREGHVKL